jgi:uncharacterized alkaline shock family protein YloU
MTQHIIDKIQGGLIMDEEFVKAFGLDEETQPEMEISSNDEESIGNIKISVDVVAKIAGIAASEIEGVSGMHTSFVGGVAQKFGAKKNTTQGVKVDIEDNMTSIDLYLVVDYGIKIPELAWSVQESVKASVESMTGLNVAAVNIHIEGINFEKDVETATEE